MNKNWEGAFNESGCIGMSQECIYNHGPGGMHGIARQSLQP